ncbi:MAG: choice-of-anchor D domain-containing protein [Bacteroidia bacterium]|nr:choice-of-anchor D domain-containing protein [Bacteroidia bacterium]
MKNNFILLSALALMLSFKAQVTNTAVITGPSSNSSPYLILSASNVTVVSLLTVGQSVGGYTFCGIADGLGAYDNGDGTFTMLLNHEFSSTSGTVHAHGQPGAFVSKWIINKSNYSVTAGSDLIQNVHLWNGSGYTMYNASNNSTLIAFGRFCAAELAPVSAFYNDQTGMGTQNRIFINGEEIGSEGRAFAHIATGPQTGHSYQLPRLGRASWENYVANPYKSNQTILIGMDDASPGQVYVYVGTKTNSGTDVDKAGLTNGTLYGVAVTGMVNESSSSVPAPNTTFSLVNLGNVSAISGSSLNTMSNNMGVTNFLRPEDGAWDPHNPNVFYFVTTNSFNSPSRLWKLQFNDINNPQNGGTITALLDGTEGQKMLDNMTVDYYGHILLQEDPGNQTYAAKIWQYDIATDLLKEIAVHDPARFVNSGPQFLTQDEESSGIVDMQGILGPGWFLFVDQAHYSLPSPMVSGGQMLLLFNPDTYTSSPEISLSGNNNSISINATTTSTLNNTHFGNVQVGTIKTNTFLIQNAGPGPLVVNSITITGSSATHYTLAAPAIPFTVNANSSQFFSINFSANSVGTFSADVTVKNNDYDENTYTFRISANTFTTTGIQEITQKPEIKIVPNPAQTKVSIQISKIPEYIIRLKMFDINGKQVKGPEDFIKTGDGTYELNVASLPEGTYLIKVSDKITEKVLINH